MAKTKIKVDVKGLDKRLKKVVPVAAEEVRRFLPSAIISSIMKGISPVSGGKRRFQKYSESYKAAIKGKAAFWTKNGRVGAISTVSNKELKSLRASKDARAANKNNKKFIEEHNKHLKGKRISPVNLKVSGKMLSSIRARKTSTSGAKLTIGFTDEKAEYHNKGTGNLPRRPLLPTVGEKFNKSITSRLQESVRRAIKRILG